VWSCKKEEEEQDRWRRRRSSSGRLAIKKNGNSIMCAMESKLLLCWGTAKLSNNGPALNSI